MTSHIRQSPGIEIWETDRSRYGRKEDHSIVGTCSFVCGFADKGPDYATTWVNTIANYEDTYGLPQNEPERYTYNAASEILARGGVLLVSRLPYDNNAKDMFSYATYDVSSFGVVTDGHIVKCSYGTPYELSSNIYKIAAAISKQVGKITDSKELSAETANVTDSLMTPYMTLGDIKDALSAMSDTLVAESSLSWLMKIDPCLTSYLEISPVPCDTGKMTMDRFDQYRVGSKGSLGKNKICVVDISRSNYDRTKYDCIMTTRTTSDGAQVSSWTNDCLGIVPVFTTAANALYFQNRHAVEALSACDAAEMSPISAVRPVKENGRKLMDNEKVEISGDMFDSQQTMPYMFSKAEFPDFGESLSKQATELFPAIDRLFEDRIDMRYARHIGLVVYKAYVDSDSGLVSYQPLESFAGSLDRNAKGPKGESQFIDDVVNSRSRYVNVFSTSDRELVNQAQFTYVGKQVATSLGFYQLDLKKKISYVESLMSPLSKVLGLAKDPNVTPIDLVVDAGLTTVAHLVGTKGSGEGQERTLDFSDASRFEDYDYALDSSNQAKWFAAAKKLDDFCKYTRRDCVYLMDAPRPFCVEGSQKRVRYTKVGSSIQADIVPQLAKLSRVNSSYAAGYCDWYYAPDAYSGEMFWCPPSIKAAGVCVYCDAYHKPWFAPAGMARGRVRNVIDCAFSPLGDEAGKIYAASWNYAVNYPLQGVVIEGQKTMQTEQTALDRLNVRRLMLSLEKRTVAVARAFLYEGNTQYTRQRFVDSLTPIYEDAKAGDGVIEYAIRCDDQLNTPEVIDRNELHCVIGVKPVKAIEWIRIQFIISSQSANVQEEVMKS